MTRSTMFLLCVTSIIMFLFVLPYPIFGQDTGKARRLELEKGAKPCLIKEVGRPYVLLNKAALESLKQEIKTPGRKQDLYEKTVKKNADRWVSREITIPERGGHYHHFVCTDGTRLIPPADQQIGTTGPYKCPACGNAGEKQIQFKRKNIDGVQTLRFQCDKCKANIDVTKKMKERK